MPSNRLPWAGLTSTLALLAADPAPAQQYWDGAGAPSDGVVAGGDGEWNTSSLNWTTADGSVNSAWTTGGSAIFFGASGTVTVASPGFLVSGLSFYSPTYTLTGADSSASLSFSSGAAVDVASGSTATLGVNLTGSTGFTKTGDGTLNLTGAKSYTGGLTVNGGTVNFSSYTGSSGAATQDFTVNSGGSLRFTSGYFAGNPFGSLSLNILVGGGGSMELAAAHSLGGSNLNGGSIGQIVLDGGSMLVTREQYLGEGLVSGEGRLILANGATISGPYDLRSADGGTTITSRASAVSNEISAKLSNSYSTFTLQVHDGSAVEDLVVSGVMSGSASNGGFVKSGLGTAVFTGANTYAGATNIQAGVLVLRGGTDRINDASAITIASGAMLDLQGTNAIQRTDAGAAITINGGTLRTSEGATHAHFGNITLNGGLLTTDSTAGSYNGENYLLRGDLTVTGSAASTIDPKDGLALSGMRTFQVADVTGSAAVDLFVNTELENSDGGVAIGGLIKTGAGTMQVTGPLTYTGGTVVDEGMLRLVNATGTYGGGALDFTVNDGGVLSFATAYWAGAPFGASTLDILVNDGGKMVVESAHAVGGLGTYNGAGIRQIILDGGELALTGAQYFQGDLIGGEGRVVLANGALISGDSYGLRSGNVGSAPLTVTSRASTETNEISAGLGLYYRDVEFQVADGAADTDLLVSGLISQGFGVRKSGAGRLALTNTNTYTGATTVTEGELRVNGSIGTNSATAVTITGVGTTLSGTGRIMGETLFGAGTILAPGASAESLDFVGNLTLTSGTTTIFEIDGASQSLGPNIHELISNGTLPAAVVGEGNAAEGAASGYGTLFDHINVTGAFTFDSSDVFQIQLTGGFTPKVGDVFNLWDAGSVNSGDWDAATGMLFSGGQWNTDFFADYGIIAFIPEPSRAGLALAFAGTVLIGRRRKE